MTEFSPQLIAMARGLYCSATQNIPAWETLTPSQQQPWIAQAQKAWGVTSGNNIAG